MNDTGAAPDWLAENTPLNDEQLEAYLDWISLRARAMATGTVQDARRSALAFAKFHYTFVEESHRPSDKVVPFAKRVSL